jgi:aerobic C4-dicarboxylate transport protein
MRLRAFVLSLYGQVLVATFAGALLAHAFPETGAAMRPLGDGFIRLVRMIVGPIIFCTVVAGIAGMRDLKSVGKAGVLTLVYFEIVTTLALAIGLVVVNLVKPGAGMDVDASSLDPGAVAQYVTAGTARSASDFLLAIIPTSPIDAFARTDILQILCFSLFFGFALHALGGTGALVFDFIDTLSKVLFGVVGIIMRTAPLGAFGAMAFTIGSFGVGTLAQLGVLIACFWLTCILFVLLVLGAIARWHGVAIWRLVAYIREELFIAFGTSSSESVLPRLMSKLEAAGVERSIVGLVVPAGYSFNLDGTAIYLSIAAIFIAQATNTPLDTTQQLVLFAILLLTSKGSAGVAGAALVVLAGTLAATGTIPVAGVALVLGIHRFMGEGMAVTNTIGNAVAAIVVGSRRDQVDRRLLRHVLGGLSSVTLAMQATDLARSIASGRAPLILDVRSRWEFLRGHVPGAIHIPFWRLRYRMAAVPSPRERPIIVYCGHGPRAWMAGAALRRHGFQDVAYLEGHMYRWRRAGLPEEHGGE